MKYSAKLRFFSKILLVFPIILHKTVYKTGRRALNSTVSMSIFNVTQIAQIDTEISQIDNSQSS